MTFKILLRKNLGLKIPLKIVTEALNSNPDYVANLKKLKIHEFRSYNVTFRRELGQLDIILFDKFKHYKGILLLIDCFTR